MVLSNRIFGYNEIEADDNELPKLVKNVEGLLNGNIENVGRDSLSDIDVILQLELQLSAPYAQKLHKQHSHSV